MANEFCRYLSNGFRIKTVESTVTYKPCCWFNTEVDLADPNFDQIRNEIHNISGWTELCAQCQTIELSGIYGKTAPRLRSFIDIPLEAPTGAPVSLEISIDTTCNAACLICSPNLSSTWARQYVKFGLRDSVADTPGTDHWIEQIKKIGPLDQVLHVNFLGGEPLKSPVPVKILRAIARVKSLDTVQVHFSTNGSLQPSPELVTLLKQCKHIHYVISLDGTHERFEYLRYPLRWNKVLRTLNHVKSLNFHNISPSIVCTLTPLNVYYYDELEQWAEEFFNSWAYSRQEPYRLITPNRAVGRLDLAHTPDNLRQAIKHKYSGHAVEKLFFDLPQLDYKPMLEFLNTWDTNRKNNWTKTFPEMIEYF